MTAKPLTTLSPLAYTRVFPPPYLLLHQHTVYCSHLKNNYFEAAFTAVIQTAFKLMSLMTTTVELLTIDILV